MDIFDLPLYYISFNYNKEIEDKCKNIGFTNINHFQAIDGRKFNTDDLLEKGMITIRSYNDLKENRQQDSGIPSLGAIGCTMSHYNLWMLCVKMNFPYIIILENDVNLPSKISGDTKLKINSALAKENSIYMSSTYKKNNNFITVLGTHFYIISNGACKELIKNTFPIDVQTDWYISNKATTKKVNIEAFKIADQKPHFSSIQSMCVKCQLPNNIFFYVFIVFFIFLSGALLTIFLKK